MAIPITYVPDPNKVDGAPVSGGTSGSGAQQIYKGRAPDPPDDASLPALNFPGGEVWDPDSQTWG